MEEEQKEDKKEDKPVSLLERTVAAAERIEAANKKTEELLNRQEKMLSEQMLAGTGGANVPKEPVKMTDEEYRKSIEKGIVPKDD